MQSDIEKLYPPVSRELLQKVLTYAMILVNIIDEENSTIMHSRRSDVWIKKNGDPDVDVTMESFDGSKLC